MWISFDFRPPARELRFSPPVQSRPDHHLVHSPSVPVRHRPLCITRKVNGWPTIILLLPGTLRHHPFGRGPNARGQHGPRVVEKLLADPPSEIPSHEVRRGLSGYAAIHCPMTSKARAAGAIPFGKAALSPFLSTG